MIVPSDTCTIIYLIEGGSPVADMAQARLQELLRDSGARAVCLRRAGQHSPSFDSAGAITRARAYKRYSHAS